MPWSKDNNPEFLRLLKELNHSVKSRQGADEEIPKESELEGEGLHEQISNETNDIDEYAPTQKPARLPKEQQGAGVLDKLERVNDVDYYVKYFTSA